MKRYTRIITISIVLSALAFAIYTAIRMPNVRNTGSDPSDGNILKVSYDRESRFIKIDYARSGSDTFQLDPDALEPEVFRLKGFDEEVYLRFFSPAFYESYGQPSQGVIILTRVDPSGLISDPYNDVASEFPVVKKPTTADLGFAVMHSYLQEHNTVEGGIPLCAPGTGDEILSEVAASSCYIHCNGNSEVMARFLPAATRVIIMGSRSEVLENGYIFLWSELHATIEIFSDNGWYVADPTYGFAYVKDETGRRLNAQELIEALATQKVDNLTFGLVRDGLIYDVPGEVVVKANTTMSGIYYTPDKSLAYRMVKSDSLMFPSQIWGR